jgi:hypothetical protein
MHRRVKTLHDGTFAGRCLHGVMKDDRRPAEEYTEGGNVAMYVYSVDTGQPAILSHIRLIHHSQISIHISSCISSFAGIEDLSI